MIPRRRALVIFPRQVGLFSLFLQVVGQLYLCRRRGIVPVVYFNDASLYWSPRGHNGVRNVWEYYFDPVSEHDVTDVVDVERSDLERCSVWEFSAREVDPYTPVPADARRIGRIGVRPGVVVSNAFPARVVAWRWGLSRGERAALHDVIRDAIRLSAPVSRKLAAFYDATLKGHDVVGVHLRGIERAPERAHLVPDGVLPLDCFTREIDAYLAERPMSRIFCATDVQASLDALRERYGDRVLHYPATRLPPSAETVGLHRASVAQYDKAQLGEEVVVECFLLSKCDFLLHGPSNVSLAATLLNPALPHLNLYEKHGYALPRLRSFISEIRGARRLGALGRRLAKGYLARVLRGRA